MKRWFKTISGLALMFALVFAFGPTGAQAADWEIGDVFVGVSSGRYQVYANDGTFKETISTGSSFTTGCVFDEDSDFYGTWFGNNLVRKLDFDHPHGVLQNIASVGGASTPESIVFAGDGSFYVGHVGGNDDIIHRDAAGTYLDQTNGFADRVGTDWIDLANDQTTMFHTSEGRNINRSNVSTNTQLAAFSVMPGSGQAFALRLLPPGDGSGGLLVADGGDIKRLNGAGAVVQTYDVAGQNSWFALNLDPNGTSFWSGDFGTSNFFRFNIASGAVEVGPINTGTGGGTLFGICVLGEITAAVNNPPQYTNPECGTTINAEPGDNVMFTVTAVDEAAQSVTLEVAGLPAGATMNPALPTSGNPVSSDFDWTPGAGDANTTTVVVFTATDDHPDNPKAAQCRVSIQVGEDLLVVLRSFDVVPGDGQATLTWETELEVDNAGFYLLRRNMATGELVRLNEGLIPAQGDVFMGARYEYEDATALNGVDYQYLLVDLDLFGVETTHPAVRAIPNPGDPAIKLAAPAYGAMIAEGTSPVFEWTPQVSRGSMLEISADPTFNDAAEMVTAPIRGVRRNGTSMQLKPKKVAQLQALAERNAGRPLYWRVSEPTLGSVVNVSDVSSLFVLQDGSIQVQGSPVRAGEDTKVERIDGPRRQGRSGR